MKLPLKWLKEYVDFNVTPEEFALKMLMRGFEVAAIEPLMADVTNVVVGRILTVDEHPNADKLHVCTVDAGQKEPLQIVCGAPNAAAGAYVPVALPDATLPGNITIRPTKMRGVESFGMLCSGKELGMTDADYPGSEVNGLLILQDAPAPGTPIAQAVDMDDIVFEIELTPNRADCQSIIGICREAAAALGQTFKEPCIKEVAGTGNAADLARVTVENTDLCPRYTARVMTDIRIAPSPRWMQKKLRSVGLRPINNIVDITNLVMVEYGHPMHAFDLACVKDGHIVVRNARENEVLRTLDGKDRAVDPSMLLIADPEKGVGIAGVMGGENSEITQETKAVLFESAVFKNSNIRATARKLRHMTDAAARFIKGVEPVNAKKALDRAIELVAELDAGTVLAGTLDACAANLDDRVIHVDTAHINRLLNTALTAEEMASMLAQIGIRAAAEDAGARLCVQIPHYRVDIESGIEADWDIAEEIGRLYGYDNIRPTLMRGDTFRGRLTESFRDEDRIKDLLAGVGAYEMYNYNFMSPAALDALLIEAGDMKRQAVRIQNPFGEDQSLMRTTLIPGMLRTAALNLNRRTGQGRFFEVGNTHFDNNPTLPEEKKKIGLIYFGENEDFFTLKGTLEELFRDFGVDACFTRGGGSYLQPGRKALITANGVLVGEIGAVHPDVLKAFDVNARAYVAELDFAALTAQKDTKKTYRALPRFPVVLRDVAVIADESVEAETLRQVILNAPVGDLIVENVSLFDVYRDSSIGENRKSLAFSFSLRNPDRTLTDEEISSAMEAVIMALRDAGANLRE